MNEKRDNCFDFLRIFAAFAIVIEHSVHHLGLSFLWFTPSNDYWFFDGVPLFFILSGFLVYKSCEKNIGINNSIKMFYANRALRIIPALYVYLIVVVLYLLSIGVINISSISQKGFIAWLLSNIFLIPVFNPETFRHFGVGVLNGSLWTIPAEVSFYIITPILFFFAKKKGFRKMIKLAILVSVLGLLLAWFFNKMPYEPIYVKLYKVTFMPYLIFFCIGILYTRLWKVIPKNKILCLIALIVYIILRYNIIFNYVHIFRGLYTVIWAIPLSYVIILTGYNFPLFLNYVTKKIGDLSYGIYIWHMIVVNSFLYFNIPMKLSFLPSTLVILIVFIITFLLAFLSWHFVEKNFLRLKLKLSSFNT